MSKVRKVTYIGQDAGGRDRHGTAGITDLVAWVEGLFDVGWRHLDVRQGSNEVGGISRLGSGPRTWWAER